MAAADGAREIFLGQAALESPVELTKGQLSITPVGAGDMSLECYTSEARKGLLEEALGVEVVIA